MTPGEQLQEYQRLLDRAAMLTTLSVHLALASILSAVVGMGGLVYEATVLVQAAWAMASMAFMAGHVVSRAAGRALARVREARRQLG